MLTIMLAKISLWPLQATSTTKNCIRPVKDTLQCPSQRPNPQNLSDQCLLPEFQPSKATWLLLLTWWQCTRRRHFSTTIFSVTYFCSGSYRTGRGQTLNCR
jgi:hypothetical protein